MWQALHCVLQHLYHCRPRHQLYNHLVVNYVAHLG